MFPSRSEPLGRIRNRLGESFTSRDPSRRQEKVPGPLRAPETRRVRFQKPQLGRIYKTGIKEYAIFDPSGRLLDVV